MCGFTFTVFLSAFQLLPTAPFHILDLGGSTFASGLFLGFLTYSSAFSAPLTGAIVDRVGQRRVLLTSSIALAVFSLAYAVIPSVPVLLALVLVHGVFWSGLLSASAAYMTNMLPRAPPRRGHRLLGAVERRRDGGRADRGFWIYRHGWVWLCVGSAALNLIMAAIAWQLPRNDAEAAEPRSNALRPRRRTLCWSGACSSSRSRCSSTRSATAASPASPRSTRTPTASRRRASI